MKKIFGAAILVSVLSITAAQADETPPAASEPLGISVGGEGTVGNYGAGGGVVAEFRREHFRIDGSIGGFSPSDGSGPRLIGGVGGLYCLEGNGDAGVCLGAPDLVRANGVHTQIGAAPVGFGFMNGRHGLLYIAPRYDFVTHEEREASMHSIGIETRFSNAIVPDRLLLDVVGQVGVAFGAEGHSSTPVVRTVEGRYFVRGGADLRWMPLSNLTVTAGIEVSEAAIAEKRDGDFVLMAPAVTGTASVQYAF